MLGNYGQQDFNMIFDLKASYTILEKETYNQRYKNQVKKSFLKGKTATKLFRLSDCREYINSIDENENKKE